MKILDCYAQFSELATKAMFAIVVICIELMLIVEFKHIEKYEIVGMDSSSPNSQSIQVKWIKHQNY